MPRLGGLPVPEGRGSEQKDANRRIVAVNALVVFVLVVHVIVSVALIVFILLHSGKGAGVSSMFGNVMPSTSSGTGIIEKNLDRITIVLSIVFAVTLLILMVAYTP